MAILLPGVIDFLFGRGDRPEYHFKCLAEQWTWVLVFFNFFLESVQVELIFDELLIDLAKEDVVLQSAEPLDPADVHVLTEL